MSCSFVRTYTVRFGEIDHAGVMYYPTLFDRMHRAFEDFWEEALGKSYSEILDGDGIGFPLIDIHSTFKVPFRFGEQMQVTIDVARIGGRSLTFRYRLSLEGESSVRAQMEMVTGVIAMDSFESCPLPEAYRQALEPYLAVED